MRVGVAGVGRIGTMHATLLSKNALVGELRICDPVPGRAAQLAGVLGGVATDSIVEFLDSDLDAVVIATSTASHAELVEQFCAQKVPVFCEKPVAMDVGAHGPGRPGRGDERHLGSRGVPATVRPGLRRAQAPGGRWGVG